MQAGVKPKQADKRTEFVAHNGAEPGRRFIDSGRISEYAKTPISWAVATGLVAGVGNNRLAPQDTATRAEIATILARLLTKRSPNATTQTLPMIAPAP